MRYADYRTRVLQLEKSMAEWRRTRADAAAGKRPWFGRIYPALLQSAQDKADRKLAALFRARQELERTFFGEVTRNANLAAAVQSDVAPEAVEQFFASTAQAIESGRGA